MTHECLGLFLYAARMGHACSFSTCPCRGSPAAHTIVDDLSAEVRRAAAGLFVRLRPTVRLSELAYYFATLKTRHQQVIAERRGFQLVGIVPGYDRDVITDGVVKRVYEALYAKLLVPSDELYIPPPESFTKRTRAVWSTLFEQD